MPKLINHGRRREEIAEATWRVIHSSGISGVSIRTVAAEAGLSTGSIRHVFPSRADLITHAMELVGLRAWDRISRHFEEADPRARATRVIHELLPLDPERRIEMEANIALIAEAPASDQVREARDASYAAVRFACRRVVENLRGAAPAPPGTDLDKDASALHALVDGLALHLLINPDPKFRENALRALEEALDALCEHPLPTPEHERIAAPPPQTRRHERVDGAAGAVRGTRLRNNTGPSRSKGASC